MQSCSSFVLLLTFLRACESTSAQSIIRHDSKGSQKSIAVDAAGVLALDLPEEAGFAETDSLQDRAEAVGTDFHGVSADATRANKSEYSSSSIFCYERDSAKLGNCWAGKPPANTPACTATSGTTVCKCPDTMCDIDQLSFSPPSTGRCAVKKIYVAEGQIHSHNSDLDVTGTTESVYCEKMVLNNQWSQQGCIAPSGSPESKPKDGWFCDSGYTSRNKKCFRKVRYISPKESCWDGWWGSGKCKNHELSYDEYSTACYNGQCVPYAFARNRQECTCSWFGWNFLVACSASSGSCGGHACVLNTGDGKKYCDYATNQNWHSLFG